MIGVYGMLWVRDKGNESFEDTMKKGCEYYKEKYNDTPTIIECSAKDKYECFEYNGANVTPSSMLAQGTIWITGNAFNVKSI